MISPIKFDILLDDGSHELRHMKLFIQIYSKLLKNDGILLIEDIPKIEWLDILSNEVPENMKKYIKTYDLRKEKKQIIEKYINTNKGATNKILKNLKI